MGKQTFTELWASLTSTEKDMVSIALAKECNVRVSTVPIWGCGARRPKSQSQEKIVEYLRTARKYKTDCKTLFPTVGSDSSNI